MEIVVAAVSDNGDGYVGLIAMGMGVVFKECGECVVSAVEGWAATRSQRWALLIEKLTSLTINQLFLNVMKVIDKPLTLIFITEKKSVFALKTPLKSAKTIKPINLKVKSFNENVNFVD
ncbi:Hypothetical predicted protein [Octopus vulgaris]|uniref:Uncharacterized protein n=1 Tax=Octopus vulgaris TaxID=6645 RepID=A0AA36BIH3_OCTVU|nr:Hypothetical predicted protein [Octopus vulgaris]